MFWNLGLSMGPIVPSVVDFRTVLKTQKRGQQRQIPTSIEQANGTYSEAYLKSLRHTGLTAPESVLAIAEIVVPTNLSPPGQEASMDEVDNHPAYPAPLSPLAPSSLQTKTRRPRSQPKPVRPICLDYLKGKCDSKRWKCKYAHPPLPVARTGGDTADDLCDVWMLTGFCKFGDACRNYHPPLEESLLGVPIAPPITQKYKDSQNNMGMQRRRPRRTPYRDFSDCSSECVEEDEEDKEPQVSTQDKRPDLISSVNAQLLSTLPATTSLTLAPLQVILAPTQNEATERGTPLLSTPSTPCSPLTHTSEADRSLRKVNGILNRLTAEKFDFFVQQLHELLSTPDGPTMQRVLPLVFAKAVSEPKLCQLYSKLVRRLYLFVDQAEQPAVSAQLMGLVRRLLLGIDDLVSRMTEDEQQAKIQAKRLGNMQFLGELFQDEVVGTDDMEDTLLALKESAQQSDGNESAFHCQLMCKLLATGGKRLDQLAPETMDKYTSSLKELVSNNSTYVQVHYLNLVELREAGWVPRRESEKPRTLAEIEQQMNSKLSSSSSSSATKVQWTLPTTGFFTDPQQASYMDAYYNPYLFYPNGYQHQTSWNYTYAHTAPLPPY